MPLEATALMPEPDALVADKFGNVMAAMFYFAPGEYYGEIADLCGFEIKSARMESDHPLMSRYEAGEEVTKEWEPPIPEGWTFGDKSDTEDGPVAIFIRRSANHD